MFCKNLFLIPHPQISEQFQNIKKNAERTELNFKSNNLECFNQPSSLTELTDYYEIS